MRESNKTYRKAEGRHSTNRRLFIEAQVSPKLHGKISKCANRLTQPALEGVVSGQLVRATPLKASVVEEESRSLARCAATAGVDLNGLPAEIEVGLLWHHGLVRAAAQVETQVRVVERAYDTRGLVGQECGDVEAGGVVRGNTGARRVSIFVGRWWKLARVRGASSDVQVLVGELGLVSRGGLQLRLQFERLRVSAR